MSKTDDPRPLGRGLPRTLKGLRGLQTQLCLSTRTKPSRRDVLESKYVVDRIGDVGSGRKADRDRKRMLAFYGDPELRRELWRHHTAFASSLAKGHRPKDADILPPTLEMQVLRRCEFIAVSTADDPQPANQGQGEASRIDGSANEVGRAVAKACDKRLNQWASLGKNERFDSALLIFCSATLLDDRGIIEKACANVPELAEEFSDLLEAARTDPSDDMDAGTSWRTACQRLSALASKAAASGADDDVLRAVRKATSALERLDSRAALKELQATVGGFLDEIAKDPVCATVDEDQLADLRGRWGGVAAGPPESARVELQRLRGAFRSGLAALRKLARQQQKAERELETLRQDEPVRGKPRREWEDRRLAGRKKASGLQQQRREAEDALLDDLAPSSETARAASAAGTREAETASTPPASSAPEGESSEASMLSENEDLRKALAAKGRDLEAIRRERDSLHGQLGRAERELSSLKRQPHSQDGCGAVDPGFSLRLAARKKEPTPLECIEAIAQAFRGQCLVLETARISAEKTALFRDGRKLLRLLLTLVNDYRDRLMNGGDAEAHHLFGDCYAAKESSRVKGTPKLRRHRIFHHDGRDIEMFQHLKIGAKADKRKTIRVHFAWDGGSKRIIIGHCGEHLPL